jgi:hypothetical protein
MTGQPRDWSAGCPRQTFEAPLGSALAHVQAAEGGIGRPGVIAVELAAKGKLYEAAAVKRMIEA